MRKKGFTLIELLAVIVILAIIALISIPLVLNTIEKGKEGAAKASTYSYIDATENAIAEYMVKNNGKNPSSFNDLTVKVKGNKPNLSNSKVCIDSGIVTEALLYFDGTNVYYNGTIAEINNSKELTDIDCEAIVIKYKLTGILKDNIGNLQSNKNMVIYSDNPHYVTTDINGYFEVTGLEDIEHEIYVLENNTMDEIKTSTKEQIISSANSYGTFTLSNKAIYLTNNLIIETTSISIDGSSDIQENIKIVTLTDDANGNNQPDIGDKIRIGTEKFYVISNDDTTISLLAEYNLYVGGKHNGSSWVSYGDEANGLQNSNMLAYISGKTETYDKHGVTEFGTTAKYSGSTAEKYVNNYINKLNTMYPKINATGGLLSKNQIESLASYYTNGSIKTLSEGPITGWAPAWLYKTSYWINYTNNSRYVWVLSSGGWYDDYGYSRGDNYGIRPVITISKSIIS